jgi:predicted PurR-regulated permease PerM
MSAIAPSAPVEASPADEADTPSARGATGATTRSGRALRTTNLALSLLIVLACVYVGRTFLFPMVLAVLLALLLRPAVSALQRGGLPETIGAALVVGLVVVALAGLAAYLYGPATRWAQMGPGEIRQLENKLRHLARPVQTVRGATDRVAEIASAAAPADSTRAAVMVERPSLANLLGTAQLAVATLLSTLMLLYFLLASGDLFLRKLIRVLPGPRDRIVAVEIWRSIQTDIGRYFAAITLINVGLGVATTLAMMALEVPSPALIGTVAAVLNFLPYVGGAATLLVILLISLFTFDGVTATLLPVLAFLALITIESQVVQPLVLGRRLEMNPVALFVWVLLWGWLWGIPGLLVAVPMLVVVRIVATRVPRLYPLAELLSRD